MPGHFRQGAGAAIMRRPLSCIVLLCGLRPLFAVPPTPSLRYSEGSDSPFTWERQSPDWHLVPKRQSGDWRSRECQIRAFGVPQTRRGAHVCDSGPATGPSTGPASNPSTEPASSGASAPVNFSAFHGGGGMLGVAPSIDPPPMRLRWTFSTRREELAAAPARNCAHDCHGPWRAGGN